MLKYHALFQLIMVLLVGFLLPTVVFPVAAAESDYLPHDNTVPDSAEETRISASETAVEKPDDEPAVRKPRPIPRPREEPMRPGPIPRARWSEDWSTLGDPAPLVDTGTPPSNEFWRPIKHIPLDESGEIYLGLGGESRLAHEVYNDKDMGISDIGLQDATQLRLAFHADLHLTQRWRIFSQLGYGKLLDSREGGEKTADECNINFWQLFIDHRLPLRDDERVVLRLGRQLIETGNLFINAGEGNNVRQVYDGLRVGWLAGDFIKAAVFAVEYVDFDDDAFGMSGTDEYFWGFRAGMRFEQPELDLHLLYTGWDLKNRQFEQGGAGNHDEQRHTLMFQLYRQLTGTRQWALDYYLAYQFGKYEDQPGDSDIRAFAGFGEVGYAWYPRANTPILGLKTAYFSGDDDPEDGQLNTFYDHVFATPFFGYARDIQPFNLIFVQPNVGYRFADRAVVTLGHGLHWRADTDDAFYGKPNGITARAGVSNSSWLGQQTQLSVRFLATPNLLISGYLARFFSGGMIEDAGGRDRDYVHVGIHYLF